MMNSIRALALSMDNIRIKKKLIISFILVVFVPVLIVGIFLTVAFRQNVLDQATQQITNNVERIKKQTFDIIRMPIEISDKLLVDSRLTNVVNTQYDSTFEVVKAFWDYRDFRDYIQLYSEIYNIRFYTTNMTILDNWEFLKVTDAIKEKPWYQSAQGEEGIHWGYIGDETKNNRNYLSLIRKITFPTYRTNGVLVIGVNQVELNAMVSQEPFDTMIIDDHGFMVAAKNPDWIGKNIDDLDFASQLTDKAEGTYAFKYDGKPSKIVIEDLMPDSSRNGLKIVSVFTIDSIVSGANRISLLGFGIIMLSLVIAFILIYIFSSILAKRMLVLNKDMNKVAMGDLNVISHVTGNDEIGILSKQFNNMVVSIRGLMDEVSESHKQQAQLQLRQKEIKLKMMASQINPHFLFNALESIRMKAHIKGETEISSIVRMLGKMIRRNLEIGTRKIALKDELEIVRCYLEIQKFRYGNDRLTFRLEVDPTGQDIEVPPLIIQPLIENAVVHGLENIAEGGFVLLTTQLIDQKLRVEVSDNGVGISEMKINEIKASLHDMEEDEEYRIGLRNVHQRLVMIYGEGVGLTLTSELGAGTRITFEIPIGGHSFA
ncbi:two-component system sensor histidine kinase YesM [Paenibacillus endophyticus]|uniref:Two-component system sensor histidine kinase YesM n=1 Tax=Paenibacillus endophyticus TaxID=1294268 RepID=A0A7W5C8S6_9BACL|nr:sensor histidine kinase [Paenibacillus endophyticus]MBB3153097.1 two-component system sensor histidine kinase YesM [Paenibacillus endophyticus]